MRNVCLFSPECDDSFRKKKTHKASKMAGSAKIPAKILKPILEATKDFCTCLPLICEQDRMRVSVTDSAHVAMMCLEFKEVLLDYSCEESCTLGMNLQSLAIVLKGADLVEFSWTKEGGQMTCREWESPV